MKEDIASMRGLLVSIALAVAAVACADWMDDFVWDDGDDGTIVREITEEEASAIDVEIVDVEIPDVKPATVEIPNPEIGTARAITLQASVVDSYPCSLYVLPESVDASKSDGIGYGSIGVVPYGLTDDYVYVATVLFPEVRPQGVEASTVGSAVVHVPLVDAIGATPASVQVASVESAGADGASIVVPLLVIPEVQIGIVSVSSVVIGGMMKIEVEDGRLQIVEIETGKVVVPEVRIVSIDGSVRIVDVATGDVVVADVRHETVDIVNVAVPSVYTPEERMSKWVAFLKEVAGMFKDSRMVENDIGIRLGNEAFEEWMEIYRSYDGKAVAHVGIPREIRMVAEARCPESVQQMATLGRNLAFYASRGYTSVLLSIYGNETESSLRATVKQIRNAGMKVWFAFSGRESLKDTLFVSPREIERCFSVVAPEAEGMLVGWRRTSVHLFLMDAEYSSFLMRTARKYNHSLAILGEGYYGQTAGSKGRTNFLTYNMPANVSGCALVGVGFSSVNPRMALNGLYGALIRYRRWL